MFNYFINGNPNNILCALTKLEKNESLSVASRWANLRKLRNWIIVIYLLRLNCAHDKFVFKFLNVGLSK